MFQSTPLANERRKVIAREAMKAFRRFNPLLSRTRGESGHHGYIFSPLSVSIHSSREREEKEPEKLGFYRTKEVSIHSSREREEKGRGV